VHDAKEKDRSREAPRRASEEAFGHMHDPRQLTLFDAITRAAFAELDATINAVTELDDKIPF
jgi:hypothetical protein